jgi:cytoskeletal protein RodZ
MSPLRQRVHNLRRRLIAASVALFIALFGGITIQLASGHDPALGSHKATTTSSSSTSSSSTSANTTSSATAPSTATSSTTAPSTTTSSTTAPSTTTSPSTSTGGSSAGQRTLAPMTTSQS